WRRGEAAGAAALLERSSGLLPPEDEQRRELLCELGIALNTAGRPGAGEEALAEAASVAARVGDRRIELRARLELVAARVLDDAEGGAARLLAVAEEALPVLEVENDERALGRLW